MGIMDKISKKSTAKKAAPTKDTAAVKATMSVAPEAKKAAAVQIVLGPAVTEKSATLQSNHKYTFIVDGAATKAQVKHAVATLYSVEPRTVHIVNVQGKAKRYGRSAGRRSDFKKAIVTLPSNQSIVIHEGV